MQQTLFLLIRQRYDLFIWKWAISWENLFLSYVNNKSADQPPDSHSLITAFVVRCLDSNKLLQLKAIHIIHCISNLSVCRYMYICLILSFTLLERCSVVRGYVCLYVYQHFQTFSPLKPLGRLKPNFMWSLLGMGERKFVQTVQVTWPRWPTCPYMVKTLKIFFAGIKRPMTLKLGMQHRVLEYYQVFQMMTLGWPWFILLQFQIWSLILLYRKKVKQ